MSPVCTTRISASDGQLCYMSVLMRPIECYNIPAAGMCDVLQISLVNITISTPDRLIFSLSSANFVKTSILFFPIQIFFLSLHCRRIRGNWRQTPERNDRGKHAMCGRRVDGKRTAYYRPPFSIGKRNFLFNILSILRF